MVLGIFDIFRIIPGPQFNVKHGNPWKILKIIQKTLPGVNHKMIWKRLWKLIGCHVKMSVFLRERCCFRLLAVYQKKSMKKARYKWTISKKISILIMHMCLLTILFCAIFIWLIFVYIFGYLSVAVRILENIFFSLA